MIVSEPGNNHDRGICTGDKYIALTHVVQVRVTRFCKTDGVRRKTLRATNFTTRVLLQMKQLREIHPGWIALLIAVAATLWLASGTLSNDASSEPQRNVSSQQSKDSELAEVQVRVSHAEPTQRTATVSGRTASVRSVTLRAHIAGRVINVAVQRGEHVEEDQLILRLDKEDLGAQLAKAKATLKQRKLAYQASQKMSEKGYQTELQVTTTKANLEAARATVSSIKTRLDHTIIRAPFAGILETLPAEEGDYLTPGDIVGRLIQQDPFIVWGSVSEDVVPYLEVGQSGTATLASGKTRKGTVSFIASVANESTRTYRVELKIDNDNSKLITGASAELHLPLETIQAHKVEPSILSLNKDGVFGIKSVTRKGRVRFHAVNIVRNNKGHIWLTGIPDTLRIITLGQGYARPGDKVNVVDDTQTSVPVPNKTTKS